MVVYSGNNNDAHHKWWFNHGDNINNSRGRSSRRGNDVNSFRKEVQKYVEKYGGSVVVFILYVTQYNGNIIWRIDSAKL